MLTGLAVAAAAYFTLSGPAVAPPKPKAVAPVGSVAPTHNELLTEFRIKLRQLRKAIAEDQNARLAVLLKELTSEKYRERLRLPLGRTAATPDYVDHLLGEISRYNAAIGTKLSPTVDTERKQMLTELILVYLKEIEQLSFLASPVSVADCRFNSQVAYLQPEYNALLKRDSKDRQLLSQIGLARCYDQVAHFFSKRFTRPPADWSISDRVLCGGSTLSHTHAAMRYYSLAISMRPRSNEPNIARARQRVTELEKLSRQGLATVADGGD